MINNAIRFYDFYTLDAPNEYGQQKLAADATPAGQIKMAIYPSTQSIQDNILYNNAQFVGLTHDTGITDDYVIQYGKERLKVLYVAQGRLTAVFLSRMV